jgi:hypothetical protein
MLTYTSICKAISSSLNVVRTMYELCSCLNLLTNTYASYLLCKLNQISVTFRRDSLSTGTIFRNPLPTVNFSQHINYYGARGGAVVKALRYKPEGRGIDSRWCQNFSLT